MATSLLAPVPTPAADRRLLLFVDIDGTFYHRSESTAIRRDRLAALAPLAHLVFASSRTVAEIRAFTARHHHRVDFIAENGALTVTRSPAVAGGFGGVARRGPGGDYLVSGDHWPAAVVADRARRALAESTTEDPAPLFASGQRGRRASVRLPAAVGARLLARGAAAALAAVGLNASLGGRWFTIWAGHDKGRAATRYRAAWARALGYHPRTGAVGNAENDAALLAAVECRWAIADRHGDYPTAVRLLPGVTRLPHHPGPAWRSIQETLAQIEEDG